MESQAYLNGRFVPASEAVLPVYDAGFVLGTTVAEQMRTFGGCLFRLDAHLARLYRSLKIVGVDPGVAPEKLAEVATQLVDRNHRLLAAEDDLGLALFVTPGHYPTMVSSGSGEPTVCLHTFPLPFRLWASKYVEGQALASTDVEQVSTRCWPAELKCRSRMHYYLADRAARLKDPQARALMLDEDGFVVEATTANVLLYRTGEGLLGPPRAKVLPGISLATLTDLAKNLGISYSERELTIDDVTGADEMLLTSTSPCVVSVTRFDGRPIGSGQVGSVQRQLLAAWSQRVGLDIAAQAEQFSNR